MVTNSSLSDKPSQVMSSKSEIDTGGRVFVRCPICGRAAEPALFARHANLEDVVQRTLSVLHPAWRPTEGACPVCVQEALDTLAASGHDLESLLMHEEARTRNHMVA